MRAAPGDRLRLVAVSVVLASLAFQQSAGLTVSDTKLDLTQNPWGFLARTLRFWEPTVAFGQVQNQAYGYLFPIGPFFGVLDSLGASPYVTGRAWWALLLVVAFLGVVQLMRALDIGTATGQVLAGVAYALAPRMLTVLGPISSEALPAALLPWILLPIVHGASGHWSPRRAALLSCVAVLCTGGVNAVATLAVLPLPALWVLLAARGRRRWRLLGWWAVGGVLATTWWLLPLLLMGEYSFPFLDYIESAAATTARTSAGEVLRGSTHWVSYLSGGSGGFWRAGGAFALQPVLVVLTALVAAAGVAGLLRPGLPGRRVWTASLLVGVAVMCAGWSGPLSGPLAPWFQEALDGVLAPLRNVHKFDALVRLPIVVGAAHLLGSVDVSRLPGWGRRRLHAVAAVLVIGSAAPLVGGQVAPSGAFVEIPPYWQEAADFVDDEAEGTTLLLPGEGFGRFAWGRTIDEPIQTLLSGPWVARQQAGPISGTGAVRLLDAVEATVARGERSPGLASVLAEAGIGMVLVRNDLDWAGTGAPRPALVRATLTQSPGFSHVATFGPTGAAERQGALTVDDGLRTGGPALEVYRVDLPVQRVSVDDARDLTVVGGDADAVLALADAGDEARRPVVLAGEDVPAELSAAEVVTTDTLRRREMSFGAIRDNTSQTFPADRALDSGGVAQDLRSVPGDQYLVTEHLLGVDHITASTSASEPGALIDRSISSYPAAAMDGNTATAWRSGTVSNGENQWWQVDFERPTSVQGLTVRLARSAVSQARPTAITVITEQGRLVTPLTGSLPEIQPVAPSGETGWLRIEASEFDGEAITRGSLGLAEVTVPGVEVERTLAVPGPGDWADSGAGNRADQRVVLTGSGGHRGCVDLEVRVTCTPLLEKAGEESGRFDRTFTLETGADGEREARLRAALSTGSLDALSPELTATASSQRVDHPGASVWAALDADPTTGWQADSGDETPTLTLSWTGARPVGGISVVVDEGGAATAPLRLRVVLGSQVHVVELQEFDRDGDHVTLAASWPPVEAQGLEISFPDVEPVASQRVSGQLVRMPLGVAELYVPALVDLLAPLRGGRALVLECQAMSPSIEVDGRAVAVQGTLDRRDAIRGIPAELTLCPAGADSGPLTWSAGRHRVVTGPGLDVRSLVLAASDDAEARQPADRRADVGRWTAERRSVLVSAGPQAVLSVAENANEGWSATVDGRRLTPVRVGGWKQGWVLPASGTATVELSYQPGTRYRQALAIGLAGVLLLVLLVAWPARRPWTPPPVTAADRPRTSPGRVRRALGVRWLLPFVALAGPAGLLALGALCLVSRRAGRPAWALAAGALVLSGVVTAAHLVWGAPWPALAFGTAHVLGTVSLAALVAAQAGLGVRRTSDDAPAGLPAAPPVGAAALTTRS